MNLIELCGGKINITAKNKRTFRGTVIDYLSPDENPTEVESIIVDTEDGTLVEFYADDIESLRIEE